MEKIRQQKNEKLEDFIKRVIEEVKNTQKVYTFEFDDDIKLSSEDFNMDDEQVFSQIQDHYILARYDRYIQRQAREIAERNMMGTEEERDYDFDYEANMEEVPLPEEIDQYLSELETHITSLNTEKIEELESKLKLLEQNKDIIRKRLIKECIEEHDNVKRQIAMREKISDSIVNKNQKKIDNLTAMISEDEEDIKIQKEKKEKEEELLKEAKLKLEELSKTEHTNQDEIDVIKREIKYLEWSVEAYTEYIEYMTEELEPTQDLIEHYQKQIELEKEKNKNYSKNAIEELQKKYGRNNKKLPIEEMPEVKSISTQISNIKEEIEKEKNSKKCQVIRNMISSNAPYSQIEEQLSLLTKNVEVKEIEDKFDLKQRKNTALDTKIEETKSKIEAQKKELDNDESFLKQEEYDEDNRKKEMLQKDIETASIEQQELEHQLDNYALLKKVPELKEKLKKSHRAVEDIEKAIELGAIPEEEIEIQKLIIDKTRKRIGDIEAQINQVKGNKPKLSESKINSKIEILRERIALNNFELRQIQNKTKEDYIDTIKLEKAKTELKELETRLESLEKTKQSSDKVTIADLKQAALEEISKFLKEKETTKQETKEETIDTYEEAPKGLLQQIKNKEFIKKAKKALASLAILVTMAAASLTSSSHEIINNSDDVITVDDEVDIEEENYEEVESYKDIGLEEPTITIEEQVKEAKEKALKKIQEAGSEAIVYDNVVSAAKEENGKTVGNHVASWENAEVGALYAVKGNEYTKINISEAERYLQEGYDVVTTFMNEDQTIGSMEIELPGKSK